MMRITTVEGETLFGTHSLAGVAACVADGGHVASGAVARTFAAGCQMAVDRRPEVRVPFDGPVVHEKIAHGRPVTVTQVTTRGTESVFTCEGAVRDGFARLLVTGRVWVEGPDAGRAL